MIHHLEFFYFDAAKIVAMNQFVVGCGYFVTLSIIS
jgi:hypothetical protein